MCVWLSRRQRDVRLRETYLRDTLFPFVETQKLPLECFKEYFRILVSETRVYVRTITLALSLAVERSDLAWLRSARAWAQDFFCVKT